MFAATDIDTGLLRSAPLPSHPTWLFVLRDGQVRVDATHCAVISKPEKKKK